MWAVLSGGSDGVSEGDPVPSGFAHPGASTGKVLSAAKAEHVEFEWLNDGKPAGTVRYEFRPGNGGARLTLTQQGDTGSADLRDSALHAWHGHIEGLAAELFKARG